MSFYSLLFGKNPAWDVLVTLLGLDPKSTDCEDAFVRRVQTHGRHAQEVLEDIKKNKPVAVMGGDKALITLIVRVGGKEFKPGKLGEPIYYLEANADTSDPSYYYVDYRIPHKFRDCMAPFATHIPFRVSERLAKQQASINQGLLLTDALTEFLAVKANDLRDEINKVLKSPVKLTLAGP